MKSAKWDRIKRSVKMGKVARNPYKITFDPEYSEMQNYYFRATKDMSIGFFIKHNDDARALLFVITMLLGAFGVAVLCELYLDWYFGV